MKKATLKRRALVTAMLLLLGAVAAYVSNADYDDALEAQRVYCSLVFKGTYPDYKNIYAEVCNADGTVRLD